MALKNKTHYTCQNCGTHAQKWLGRCPGCGSWNTFVEEMIETGISVGSPSKGKGKGSGGAVLLDSEEREDAPLFRFSTGIDELNRVLGGGLVKDSFVLLGGDPGVGKSTLLLQAAAGLIGQNPNIKILYTSGEESVGQIRDRARRLKIEGQNRIFLESETSLESLIETCRDLKPEVVIVDSLQTFSSSHLESPPGSVSQVREVAAKLMHLAKTTSTAVLLVGHVTKEGSIAGPKVVEHMVDTVLYFEAESQQSFRILRTVKNRFGNARELGVFEMFGEGLNEVSNPSSLFLEDRKTSVPGTAVSACLEGTRPLLIEFQALVSRSSLAVPRRTSVGFDSARVSLLAAILEKHLRLPLYQEDLFFNVAGGLRISEPACDLGAAAAIYSSCQEVVVPSDWVWMGEVGLTGELRSVTFPEVRVEEARKLGFSAAVVPVRVLKLLEERGYKQKFKLIGIQSIHELKEVLRGGR